MFPSIFDILMYITILIVLIFGLNVIVELHFQMDDMGRHIRYVDDVLEQKSLRFKIRQTLEREVEECIKEYPLEECFNLR